MPDTFINSLLSQMTLKEKIGQLNQYAAWGNFDPEVVRQGQAGSVINATGALTGSGQSDSSSAEICNHIQGFALESRLKIPLIFGRDVIHGYRTVFPIPLGQAAAFNPGLAEEASAVAAREASADGVKWTFAPMLDIARDPRWGRTAEGNGEDPYLGALLAAAVVRGFQGSDYSAPDRIVACAKHYVGYGAAEGGRDYDNGEISEPTLRDVYLPPYKAAVNAGAGTVMSAFLDLNGVPASADRRLLTDVLRGEWGFDGFVVSDWDSVLELINHGIVEDKAGAAVAALHAGVDMDMASRSYVDTLEESLQAGKISLEEIEQGVRRILRIKQRAGLFERPFTDIRRGEHEMLTEDDRALARKFARQSMVLLKNNDNILPLDPQRFKRILLGGNFLHATWELFGCWAPDGRAETVTPPVKALRQAAPKGLDLWQADHADQLIDHAAQCDAVVLLLGEYPNRSGENNSVSDLGLPPGQAQLIEALAAQGKPIVLVVFAGRPLALGRVVNLVDAVLYAWHPGIEGAAALGELLFGQASPSGKLPMTMPRVTGQVPFYYNHKNTGRPLTSPNFFRVRYVDSPNTPLYPFGYGLSYTNFAYSSLNLSSEKLRGSLEISAQITNTGSRSADEVVQLYVRDLVGSLTRPVRELKGIRRITLEPGASERVSFTLTESDLAFTRADGSFGTEPGRFQVWVAPDSAGGLQGEFIL